MEKKSENGMVTRVVTCLATQLTSGSKGNGISITTGWVSIAIDLME